MRILIANRGEIAVRIIRTAHRLGHQTVAAYADPDREAPFVRHATVATRLGPAELDRSYLSIDALLDAATRCGATAVHPGYGFLSERGDLARAVEAAGLVWIGPRPDVIERMGSKIEARKLAKRAGVPVIPGFDTSQDDAELTAAALGLGYPVLIKASAGGGGKGIRIAENPTQLPAAIQEARTEAARAFGDDDLIVERYITRPRHIEVQIIGDKHGNVVDLGTRECSVQRRYQKVLEEAPAPNLEPATEATLRTAAVALAKAIDYDSVGTVEFVVDDATGDAFFLEMNTRLQVEHPVTEAVAGLDLVELQLRVAAGEPSPFPLGGMTFRGHAFEARVNAEDPFHGFAPQSGTISAIEVPTDVRWDSGVEVGSVVTPRYDSMIGKLVVHGPDRDSARRLLLAAVDQMLIAGIRTNGGLHHWLLTQQPIVDGRVTTRFLDDTELPRHARDTDAAALATIGWLAAREQAATRADVWHRMGPRRFTPHEGRRTVVLENLDGAVFEMAVTGTSSDLLVSGRHMTRISVDGERLSWTELGVERNIPAHIDLLRRSVSVALEGDTETFSVRSRIQHSAAEAQNTTGSAANLLAPFPAVVSDVCVKAGDDVAEGVTLVVLEAMKVLHFLTAEGNGRVAAVLVEPGDQVTTGDILVRFEELA